MRVEAILLILVAIQVSSAGLILLAGRGLRARGLRARIERWLPQVTAGLAGTMVLGSVLALSGPVWLADDSSRVPAPGALFVLNLVGTTLGLSAAAVTLALPPSFILARWLAFHAPRRAAWAVRAGLWVGAALPGPALVLALVVTFPQWMGVAPAIAIVALGLLILFRATLLAELAYRGVGRAARASALGLGLTARETSERAVAPLASPAINRLQARLLALALGEASITGALGQLLRAPGGPASLPNESWPLLDAGNFVMIQLSLGQLGLAAIAVLPLIALCIYLEALAIGIGGFRRLAAAR